MRFKLHDFNWCRNCTHHHLDGPMCDLPYWKLVICTKTNLFFHQMQINLDEFDCVETLALFESFDLLQIYMCDQLQFVCNNAKKAMDASADLFHMPPTRLNRYEIELKAWKAAKSLHDINAENVYIITTIGEIYLREINSDIPIFIGDVPK